MTSAPRVSVAIPLYNEESGVGELLRRVRAVLDALPGGPHELVLVNDGSSDRTLDLLEQAALHDERIVVISLSRNFGHQAALTAALDHVTGDVTILMDGDLQDEPENIPRFLERYRDGFDVVYAIRERRREPFWLRVCYFVFYRALAGMSDVRLPLDAGDFGLMSRRVVQELRRYPERHRYLRGLRAWAGFRQTGIALDRPQRFAGTSKYSMTKLVGLALDGVFSFSTVPLRMATLVGAFAIAASTLFALYALYVRIVLERSPQGFTALMLLIVFLSGVNLFFLGVIGEYLGRVYEQVKARPSYVVGRVIRRASPERQPSTLV
ncbi:MAG TPA: glycosyltransferase family 2 protein [Gemmatimonadaceae bacterium]|nr:glycosyltransferase family 2 protein [Gemmatimonadaceae bacterium]